MTSSAPEQPPVTGHRAIDEALIALDLSGPVGEHAERVQAVHTVLQQVLNPASEQR
ncbi:MAG: hypothetical protein R2703_06240 [Micropruina glycogenica]|jgi:hypothetical protein|uniref:Uncharacterized protein n=1 Tax=Micropruina glycogenica TaxID=75385 RepID=A0A2N9JF94_9ACTN|nr:hypothetical protein [Micropruina glycogenica]MCB0891011.1 hypothetical protein [Propionibacteriaceae bacterium]SPD86791.1 conserved protein of unknown function [Micropruina glycogenica]